MYLDLRTYVCVDMYADCRNLATVKSYLSKNYNCAFHFSCPEQDNWLWPKVYINKPEQ